MSIFKKIFNSDKKGGRERRKSILRAPKTLSFSGRHICIFDASTPLGNELALSLSHGEQQNRLVLVGRDGTLESLKEIASKCEELNGDKVPCLTMEECSEESIKDVVESATSALDGLGVLIYTGNYPLIVKEELSFEEEFDLFEKTMALNFYAPYYAINYALKNLKDSHGTPTILLVSTIAGEHAPANMGMYCAARTALHSFLDKLSEQFADVNLCVNVSSQVCNTLLSPKGDVIATDQATQIEVQEVVKSSLRCGMQGKKVNYGAAETKLKSELTDFSIR